MILFSGIWYLIDFFTFIFCRWAEYPECFEHAPEWGLLLIGLDYKLELKLYKRRIREKILLKIVGVLPRPIIYWASIRMIANATTGKYGDTIVPELEAMEALKRWENGNE